MTNEEIKLKIAGHLSAHSYEVGDNILPLVDLVRSLVAQAYEEAAKAMCWYCNEGMPVVAGSYGSLSHRGDEHGTLTDCDASAVRALRDSLAETVSS